MQSLNNTSDTNDWEEDPEVLDFLNEMDKTGPWLSLIHI